MSNTVTLLKENIRNVADFPIPGISFKDITPILSDPALLRESIDALKATVSDKPIDKVVALDARGFLFATPIALELNAGLIPIRKKGKLPWLTHEESYSLEYEENIVEIHQDAISPGENILIIDDLLATGGTALAAMNLIEKLGGNLVAASFLIELTALNGRSLLGDAPVHTVVQY